MMEKRKRGRPPVSDKTMIPVTFHIDVDDLAKIDAQRADITRSEALRQMVCWALTEAAAQRRRLKD